MRDGRSSHWSYIEHGILSSSYEALILHETFSRCTGQIFACVQCCRVEDGDMLLDITGIIVSYDSTPPLIKDPMGRSGRNRPCRATAGSGAFLRRFRGAAAVPLVRIRVPVPVTRLVRGVAADHLCTLRPNLTSPSDLSQPDQI